MFRMSIVLLAALGCRGSEVQLVPLTHVTARSGVVSEDGATIHAGMDSVACGIPTLETGSFSGELPIEARRVDVYDVCGDTLMASGPGVFWHIPDYEEVLDVAALEVVDAACLGDGWVVLTDDCTLVWDDGTEQGAPDCDAVLIRFGDTVWLDGTDAVWPVVDGELDRPLGVDALWVDPQTGVRVTATGRVVTATGAHGELWRTELSERINGLTGLPDAVGARGESGTLWALDREDGAVITWSEGLLSDGTLQSSADGRIVTVQLEGGLRAWRVAIGSIAPN